MEVLVAWIISGHDKRTNKGHKGITGLGWKSSHVYFLYTQLLKSRPYLFSILSTLALSAHPPQAWCPPLCTSFPPAYHLFPIVHIEETMFLNTRAPVPSRSNDISLDKAELVAIFLEALLYGEYILISWSSFRYIFCISLTGVEALIFVATVYLLHGAKHTKVLLCKFGFVIVMFLLNTIVSLFPFSFRISYLIFCSTWVQVYAVYSMPSLAPLAILSQMPRRISPISLVSCIAS